MNVTPYVSVNEAWDYFNTRLDIRDWETASDSQKLAALTTATRLINNLRFKGHKLTPTQINEFPRTNHHHYDGACPDEIRIATCEIAINLLDGTDVEQEIENLFATGQSYATVKTGYDSKAVPDYMRAGIPSAVAWNYLRPFLADPRKITLRRVD